MIYRELTRQTVDKLVYAMLKSIEESNHWKAGVYADSKGIKTIGVGLNIEAGATRDLVLKRFGFTNTPLDHSYRARIISAIGSAGSAEVLQSQLDRIMSERAARVGGRTQFRFANEGEVLATVSEYVDTVARVQVRNWAAGLPNFKIDSYEGAALISLAFNTPKLLGKGLRNALSGENRADAWFEIQYRSNLDKSAGLAKRRTIEAAVFGISDLGNDLNTGEVRQLVSSPQGR